MKNINYIINGILGAAVIVLFVLFFTGNTASSSATAGIQSETTVDATPGSIAYFEVDSVLANWALYHKMQEDMVKKQTQLETDFEGKSQGFSKRVEDAQYKIQRGLVTRAESEQLQQQLAAEEQQLMSLQNDYSRQLQEEGIVKNRQMIDKIEQYLKVYNEPKGYSYIFSYTFGGNLLYGDQAYNVTGEIIEGINAEYPVEVTE